MKSSNKNMINAFTVGKITLSRSSVVEFMFNLVLTFITKFKKKNIFEIMSYYYAFCSILSCTEV